MTLRHGRLAALALAALSLTPVSPLARRDAQAAGPVLVAGLGGIGDTCARRPPGPPRFVASTPVRDFFGFADRTTLSWGLPLDVILGTTCGTVTQFQLSWAFQRRDGSSLRCGMLRDMPWEFHDAGVVGGSTFSKVLPEERPFFDGGWFSFSVRARNQWGWGNWSAWTPAECFDSTLRGWP